MQKYRVVAQMYSEAGALVNEYLQTEFDSAQSAINKYIELDKARYVTIDPDTGKQTIGGKQYKVELRQAVYTTINDVNEFVEVNALEYFR